MGTRIAMRGSIPDLDTLRVLEDHAIDLALDLGGYAHIRRGGLRGERGSAPGVLLDLVPGLQSIPILRGPRGRLIPEGATPRARKPPASVTIETRFAPMSAHVVAVTLLDALRARFLPKLVVVDDLGFWETRRVDLLRAARSKAGLDAKADDAECARLVALVQRAMTRPPEHKPVRFKESDDPLADGDRYGTEAEWDEEHKQQERRKARMGREIEERISAGASDREALDAAIDAEVPEEPPNLEEGGEKELDAGDEMAEAVAGPEEPDSEFAPPGDRREREHHPVLRQAMDLVVRSMRWKCSERRESTWPLPTIRWGLMEATGGLSQVFSRFDPEDDDEGPIGLNVVQLKRALKGVTFALGSLPAAQAMKALPGAEVRHLSRKLDDLRARITDELSRARRRWKGDS